ncbi:ParB/RepB/Spo0J family partition protein [Candidatus Saccharibacteria bacterium]|nr:ParB/RepB/Spo0J family partition protein [Candidatus Saccharibacteria bacterium]
MSAKKGLGRGFDSLIPNELLDEEFDPTAAQDEKVSDLRHIRLEKITPDPEQPRRTFDDLSLEELAESVREHGILQPIVVTPHKDGYMIVAGERRYHATKRAGLDKIPALVRTLSNQHKLELSLIENLQRRDLNVLETATAYLKLRDQFNLTLDQIGQRVGGKSIAAISNTLRLLRLPQAVREALADGRMREGQARPLVNLDEETIQKILPVILKEEWSSRAVEQYVTRLKSSKLKVATKGTESPIETPYHSESKDIERKLRAQVTVKTTSRGSGQIIIQFKNDNEFKRISKILR